MSKIGNSNEQGGNIPGFNLNLNDFIPNKNFYS